jgi:hypothetical protein
MAWSGGKQAEAARSRMLHASASAAELVDAMRDGVLACGTGSLRAAEQAGHAGYA